jgi:hypothetical protein
MAGITLATAQAQLDAYVAAEIAILKRQEYVIEGRRLRFADLAEVRAGIAAWDQKVKSLSSSAAGRGRSITIRPRF